MNWVKMLMTMTTMMRAHSSDSNPEFTLAAPRLQAKTTCEHEWRFVNGGATMIVRQTDWFLM